VAEWVRAQFPWKFAEKCCLTLEQVYDGEQKRKLAGGVNPLWRVRIQLINWLAGMGIGPKGNGMRGGGGKRGQCRQPNCFREFVSAAQRRPAAFSIGSLLLLLAEARPLLLVRRPTFYDCLAPILDRNRCRRLWAICGCGGPAAATT
jgi:hypothetical protein